MKPIDAEKLIAEIKRQRDGAIERQKKLEKIGQETVLNEMLALKLNRLLSFIASLQQEQPEVDLDAIVNKAKAYDDALERAKRIKDGKGNWRFSDLSVIEPAVTEIFPVLKEFEDERIRKHIIEILERLSPCHWDGNEKSECIAYLEKQKEPLTPEEKMNHPLYLEGFDVGRKVGQVEAEQKHAEWSDEDEKMRRRAICACNFTIDRTFSETHYGEARDWLKSLPERFNLQPKQEWSEKDEEMYARVVRRYTDYEGVIMRTKEESVANKMLDAMEQEEIWLKSLLSRPKKSDNLPKWKKASAGTKLPSESVIRRDGEDPRFGSVAVYDCEYITINELGKLPKED